mmetsp:Transcript_118213/g.346299  ORF Transcript_118213/g.346299 Transcript_118213/m.346299 type:complete len:223 (-) Transcript_118213:405-1073(-)
MGVKLKCQEGNVRGHHNQCAYPGDGQNLGVVRGEVVEHRRQSKRHAGEEQERHADERALRGELLLLLQADVGVGRAQERVVPSMASGAGCQTAEDEGTAEHEQDVGEHGAQEGGLDDREFVLADRLHRDDHLHGVAEARVQEAADRLVAQAGCKLLSRVPQELCQWHKCHKVQPERPRAAPLELRRQNAQRHADQEDAEGMRKDCVEAKAVVGPLTLRPWMR